VSDDTRQWDGTEENARDLLLWVIGPKGLDSPASVRYVAEVTKEQAAERTKVVGDKVDTDRAHLYLDQAGIGVEEVEVGGWVVRNDDGTFSVETAETVM
jgi:hypothetical protein